MLNHAACKTPGWQFIARSGFKPRIDSFEASLHTFRAEAILLALTKFIKIKLTKDESVELCFDELKARLFKLINCCLLV